MAQTSRREDVRSLFYSLADEEKLHLRGLGELFRKKMVGSGP
jgi:rubrerythrin